MKNIKKMALILAALSLFTLSLSACQKGSSGKPEANNDDKAGIVDDQGRGGGEDGEEKAQGEEDGETEVEAGQGTETGEGATKGEFGKLNIEPKVTLTENRDYVKLDSPSVDFELKDLEGKDVKLSDYRGQIVFLNFWATWCPPCRAEMPDMEEIHKEYGDKGVAILAVSSTITELRGTGNDSEKAEKQVRNFIGKEGFTFTIPLDREDEVAAEYSNIFPISGIPTTFMIDREGNVRYGKIGPFDSKDQMEAFIALLDQ